MVASVAGAIFFAACGGVDRAYFTNGRGDASGAGAASSGDAHAPTPKEDANGPAPSSDANGPMPNGDASNDAPTSNADARDDGAMSNSDASDDGATSNSDASDDGPTSNASGRDGAPRGPRQSSSTVPDSSSNIDTRRDGARDDAPR